MEQPHDRLFQLVFAEPEHAAPLLRSGLPAPIVAAIDWPTLARLEPVHRGKKGKQTICDCLFSVRLTTGGDLLLYVVLEHKSQSRRFDALQMLEQVTAVLRTHRRRHPDDPFLPPVLPIVVHADHRPFVSPLQVRELFDLDHIPTPLHRFLPSLEFVLDDLHTAPPERLRQRALTVFGLCSLAMLEYLPPAARDEWSFEAWVDAWRDVQDAAAGLADTESGRELWEALVDYVLATSDLPRPVLTRVLSRRLTDTAMKKFVSTKQQIRNEGIVDTLLRQLTRRFGADAARAVEERLREASIADLDRFVDRVLDAATIDDVFRD